MKMHAVLKGIGTLLVLAYSWMTSTLSPLIWVLLGLVLLDVLLHIHKGMEPQYKKLWAAFAALGIPTYLGANSTDVLALNPEVLKVVVAALCIGYVQVVLPDILALIGKLRLSKDPVTNATEIDILKSMVQDLSTRLDAQAETTVQQAGIGPVQGAGTTEPSH